VTALLKVENLTVALPTRSGYAKAVDDLSFAVDAGEVMGIAGESGSGKTLTALSLFGLLPHGARVTGSIRLDGTELLGLPARQLRSIRGRQIAMVSQDPATALHPILPVGTQLTEHMRHHLGVTKAEARDRAAGLLAEVGLPDPRRALDRYPHELSGGMRQRVVIAIALSNSPSLLIADEATTALDVTVQAQILDLVAGLQSEHGTGVIWITHDLGVVAGIADRVLVMYGGRCVEDGTVDDVLERPAHPYTRGLLGALPDLATSDDGELATVPGVPPAPTDLPPGCVFWPRCPARSDPRCATEQPPLALVGASCGGLPHRAATWCEEGGPGGR
jgi:peptide/nickel transport system ATP-binding protein